MNESTADAAAITGIDFVGYNVRDPVAATAFYRDVLGMTPTDEDERGAEFTLADGSTFGVWQPDAPADPTGIEVMFAVGDVATAVARIRERGGTIEEPVETAVCFMAVGRDPEGNAFIIHRRKTDA